MKTPAQEKSAAPAAEAQPTAASTIETASQALAAAVESIALGHPVEDFPEFVKKVLAGFEIVSKTSGFSFLKGTSTVPTRNSHVVEELCCALGVVSSIKSIANDETKREDKMDLPAHSFVIQLLNTFSPLWQLHKIKLPVSVTESGVSLATRLEELLDDFDTEIAHSANLIDAYHSTQKPGPFHFLRFIIVILKTNISSR